MELVGRLTKDATVKVVAEERKVVNFSIAINNGYSKDGEWVDKVVFVDCAFWLRHSTAISKYLTKGRQVELFGEIGVNAYLDKSNEPVGKLTFRVMHIKLGSKPKSDKPEVKGEPVVKAEAVTSEDDLPF